MSIKTRQILSMASGVIVLLFLGTTMAWSIFLVPVESTFGWTRSQTSMASTVCTMAFSIGSIVAGMLSRKISFSNVLKIAAICLFGGFFMASIMKPGSSIFLLYLSYGVLVGSAAGMGYNCILSACPLWMSTKPATANGILLMGYALSTAIFAPVIQSLLVSTNSVNAVWRILAFVCGIGVLVFSFLVRSPNLEESSQLPQPQRNSNKKSYNIITGEMIKMPIFWVYYIITILIPAVGLSLVNHNSPILTGLGASASTAALIISICSLFNGGSRFAFGFIYDKLGVKKSMIVIYAVNLAAAVVVFLGFNMNNLAIYIIGACLMMIGFGFNATSMPSILREVFGHRTFSLNYSILCTDAFITAWFPSIMGMLQTNTGSYQLPITVMLGITLVNLGVTIVFLVLYRNEMKKREG